MEIYIISLLILNLVFTIILLVKLSSKSKNNNYSNNNEFIIKSLNETNNKVKDDLINFLNNISKLNNDISKEINDKLLLIKDDNSKNLIDIIEKQTKQSNEIEGKLQNFNKVITMDLKSFQEEVSKTLKEKIKEINDNVESKLGKNFEETSKTFNELNLRIGKIDEAQKQMENLTTNIISLQDILTNKQARGVFGEVQLSQILANVYSENKALFQTQYKLSNDKVVDAVVFAPEPLGLITIDSKFPLENYRKMIDNNLEKNNYKNLFIQDIKNHIKDISAKYIIKNETSDYSIMFVPSEVVFAEIQKFPELVDYSYKMKVTIASPSTLITILTVIYIQVKNIQVNKFGKTIQIELDKLNEEFNRFKERWVKLRNSFESTNKNFKELDITTSKITNKFDSISNVKTIENKE